MAKIPTMVVWDPNSGRRIINASDYDPDVHEEYLDQDEVPLTEDPEPLPEVADGGYEIVQKGPWHTIHDSDGEKVGKSHRSEGEAREALRELIADGD